MTHLLVWGEKNQNDIWIALYTQAPAVIRMKGRCGRKWDDADKALHDALGKERMEEIRLNTPKGLELHVEACVTRWGLLFAGAAHLAMNLPFLSALFPLALAERSQENKMEAMNAVCSKGGFVDRKRIAYTNPRVEKAVHHMMQPEFILRLSIVLFLNEFVLHPCLAASAHRHECAMTKLRGLGSIVRVALWVVLHGLWVASS